MTASAHIPSGSRRDRDEIEPPTEDLRILAALRDDIAANTHPDEPVPLSSALVCELIDEIIWLRTITHPAATAAQPSGVPRT